MLTVDQYEYIRIAYRVYGKTIRKIARETGHSRNTVKKYWIMNTWNTVPEKINHIHHLDYFQDDFLDTLLKQVCYATWTSWKVPKSSYRVLRSNRLYLFRFFFSCPQKYHQYFLLEILSSVLFDSAGLPKEISVNSFRIIKTFALFIIYEEHRSQKCIH